MECDEEAHADREVSCELAKLTDTCAAFPGCEVLFVRVAVPYSAPLAGYEAIAAAAAAAAVGLLEAPEMPALRVGGRPGELPGVVYVNYPGDSVHARAARASPSVVVLGMS